MTYQLLLLLSFLSLGSFSPRLAPLHTTLGRRKSTQPWEMFSGCKIPTRFVLRLAAMLVFAHDTQGVVCVTIKTVQ